MERILKWLREEEAWMITVVVFEAYGIPLETAEEFKYLGRVLTPPDDDWSEVSTNLRKLRRRWARI